MKILYFVLIWSSWLLIACENTYKEIVPDFNVEVESVTCKVGEEVAFNFSGTTNQLSFYSGELMHEYTYRDQSRRSQTQSVRASFSTNVTYNNQPDQLAVFLSTDYNGGGTHQDVSGATWGSEISENFAIAPEDNPWGSPNNFPSGTVDLIDAFEADKPLYIGFRYKNTPGTGIPRNWYLYSFNIDVATLLGGSKLFSSYAGFNLVYGEEFDNESLKTSEISSNNSYIMLRLPPELRGAETEIWAISPPIYLEEIDHGPDKPKENIKGFRDPMPTEFTYTYNIPGTYKATFVGYNASTYGEQEIARVIELTVTE